jgi:hypothetical protein
MDFSKFKFEEEQRATFNVIDLGFGPGDSGGGGRVREPRRPNPGSSSGSAELPT